MESISSRQRRISSALVAVGLFSQCLTNQLTRFVVLAFAIGMAGCGYFVTPRGPLVPVQAKAPEFSLSDQGGETVSLHGLLQKGQAVLVFYRGHW
jgi:hypothetical protein